MVFHGGAGGSPLAAVGSPDLGALMSNPSPSPRLRPEDLPQAAVLVANMIEAFLDAQKTQESDGNDSAKKPHEQTSLIDKEPLDDPIENHTKTSRPEGVRLRASINSRPGAAPSREHAEAVCLERQSSGARLGCAKVDIATVWSSFGNHLRTHYGNA